MDRRRFIAATASSLILVPAALKAQPAAQVRRIGWLWNQASVTPADFREYTKYLRALGWIEGQNLLIEQRYTSANASLLPALAEELVWLKVEIIVAEGTVVALAAKRTPSRSSLTGRATQSVPVSSRALLAPARTLQVRP